ncbi:MAG: adenosylmethionine--8-amino-7-oxononanoate transaminase [Candidatus Omnitrophota bacterium]
MKQQLEEKDKRYVWHPFTQMKDWEAEDIIIIEEGQGEYLKDINGNMYIDGVSSLWTNVHGHRKKEIDEALKKQIEKIAHSTFLGLSNVPAILLAEKLVTIAPPGLEKVFFADSGSEAMEVALKVAYQYWCQKKKPEPQRKKFVHLTHSYHGDTLGSVSVGGIDLFHKVYKPLLFEAMSAPAPYCYRCPLGLAKENCEMQCFRELSLIVEKNKEKIAAVIIEPLMQGAAGMINQPPGYISSIRKLTKECGILLIFDEVATGFGRTGTLFAADREEVSPDILALGKGITGGYLPLSATLFTKEIFNAFLGEYDEFRSFFHGHTYTANQLASQAALSNIEIFEKENVIKQIQTKVALLKEKLVRFNALEHVGDIRQVGLMVGIELVQNKTTKEAYAPGEKIGIKVIKEAQREGVIIRPLGNVIVLMPPLSISHDVLSRLIDVVYNSIRVVTEERIGCVS